MGNLGLPEMLVIAVIALIFFGPSKMPEIGKSLGQGIAEFKKAFSSGKSESADPGEAHAATNPSASEKANS